MLFVASALSSMLMMIGKEGGRRKGADLLAMHASMIRSEWHLHHFAFSSFPFTVWEVSFFSPDSESSEIACCMSYRTSHMCMKEAETVTKKNPSY